MRVAAFIRRAKRLGLLGAGFAAPLEAAERRYASVARATISAFGARGIGLAVSLVTVPLTVGYLGAERYGAWMTINSFLAWLILADAGLGNELVNALSSAFGKDDTASARVSTATGFWILGGLGALLAMAGGIAWLFLDVPALINVSGPQAVAEVRSATAMAYLLFCISLPLSVVDRVYVSHQQGATANGWAVAGNLASLLSILIVVRTEGGLPWLVAASGGARTMVKVVAAVWLFGAVKPLLRPSISAVDRTVAVALMSGGRDFFLVQVGAVALFSTDNVIIAHVLGPSAVTPYAVSGQLFSIPNMAIGLAFPYLWAAYAEALARNDSMWILRTLRVTVWGSAAVATLLTLPLFGFGRSIVAAWVGDSAMPPQSLLFWMGAWTIILGPANAAICLLNAMGYIRWQAWVGILTAALNIGLSVLWARSHGISGVMAATVVSYVCCAIVPVMIYTRRGVERVTQAGFRLEKDAHAADVSVRQKVNG